VGTAVVLRKKSRIPMVATIQLVDGRWSSAPNEIDGSGVVGPFVNGSDFTNKSLPSWMVNIHQTVVVPMKVISDVRDLLIETVSRVRQNPPEAPPATSTMKVF
jgi:hypothetical protein